MPVPLYLRSREALPDFTDTDAKEAELQFQASLELLAFSACRSTHRNYPTHSKAEQRPGFWRVGSNGVDSQATPVRLTSFIIADG